MYCHICLFSLKDLVQTRQHRHVRVKCTVQSVYSTVGRNSIICTNSSTERHVDVPPRLGTIEMRRLGLGQSSHDPHQLNTNHTRNNTQYNKANSPIVAKWVNWN